MTSSVSIIVTPATTRDLVTLADLREQLQFKPTDTADDIWLQKVISRTSLQIEQYCNRIFAQQGYQDSWGIVTGEQGAPLILAQAPIGASTLVTIDGTALTASDFTVDANAGLLYRATDPLAWQSTSTLVVSYNGGFTTIPVDIQMAALEMCVMEYRGRNRDPMLRERETPGLGRETYWVGPIPGQSLPGNLGPAFEPYRRGGVG
jgi:hypothetical protein